MKTLKISILAILAIFAVSCETDDVENRPVVQGIDAPVLTAPEEGNVYILNGDNIDGLAERFMWSVGNFGEGIIPTYTIQIDSLGQNFDTPITIGSTVGTTQFAASNAMLNNAIDQLGAEPEVSGSYEVRIMANVGEVVMYSEPVEMLITGYQGFQPLKNLYVVGTATEFGFNNNAGNTPLFRDSVDQNLFHLTAYFNAGELKLLENLGAWQPQYGSSNGSTLEGVVGTTDPAAFVVANAGYYTLTVNLAEMTFAMVPYLAGATATTYPTIGITGSATPNGWPDNGVQDMDMTASTTNPHIWKIENIAMIAGAAKFRANDAWTTNWGGGSAPAGMASLNGSDIPVTTEGTYDVWFNDLDMRYIFIPQQ